MKQVLSIMLFGYILMVSQNGLLVEHTQSCATWTPCYFHLIYKLLNFSLRIGCTLVSTDAISFVNKLNKGNDNHCTWFLNLFRFCLCCLKVYPRSHRHLVTCTEIEIHLIWTYKQNLPFPDFTWSPVSDTFGLLQWSGVVDKFQIMTD